MKALLAKDTLTPLLVRVSAWARPAPSNGPGAVYAVFSDCADESVGSFLGLVTSQAIARFPDRIFADLVPLESQTLISADSGLDEVEARFADPALMALPVAQDGRFLGAVTRESLLGALLRRDRFLIEQTNALRENLTRLLAENRRLSRHLLGVLEEERRHIARELHDEVGQCITAIQAEAETINVLGSSLDPRIRQCAGSIGDLGSRLYDAVHAMLRRLRPELLDDLGLTEAVRYTVRTWQAHYPEIQCRVRLGEGLDELDEAVGIVVYRVVQECLTNIARHARASAVVLRMSRRRGAAGEYLCLRVRDNGRGLNGTKAGLGLVGLRERVETLGGEFRLRTPGHGICVRVRIPLHEGLAGGQALPPLAGAI